MKFSVRSSAVAGLVLVTTLVWLAIEKGRLVLTELRIKFAAEQVAFFNEMARRRLFEG